MRKAYTRAASCKEVLSYHDEALCESASLDKGAAITLSQVNKFYGANHVLRDVSFQLEAGSITCLMAPSGSGKTTLFRVLLGLESVTSGTITGAIPGHVSMMFQEDRLCEMLTPIENVALVLPRRVQSGEIEQALIQILPEDCMTRQARYLSGGMRRRVSLARAALFPSSLIVLDEPFTGLDRATKQTVIDFLLSRRQGRTLLVATHSEEDVELLGAKKLMLDAVQDGGKQDSASQIGVTPYGSSQKKQIKDGGAR